MPIYEFYCPDCHRIFSFLARSAGSRKRPACPRCGKPRLDRRPSTFAVSRGGSGEAEDSGGDLPAGMDEQRIEQAMEGLAREAESVSDDDPQGMARLMRQFYDRTGLPMGEGVEEALRRMQDGEDPDLVEEELGVALDRDDPFAAPGDASGRRRRRPRGRPQIDPELYELD
jgi:putative FmdB family regulatory protein